MLRCCTFYSRNPIFAAICIDLFIWGICKLNISFGTNSAEVRNISGIVVANTRQITGNMTDFRGVCSKTFIFNLHNADKQIDVNSSEIGVS
jgi:hypothetical protein